MAWFGQAKSFLSDSLTTRQTNLPPLLAVTGVSVALSLILQSALTREHSHQGVSILPSPRRPSIPDASANDSHPLPNDVLPGARDVASPYGTLRVYEWGPVDGPKVLFVHGITTPCVSLGGIAHALVDRGCRVMLFDLYAIDRPPEL